MALFSMSAPSAFNNVIREKIAFACSVGSKRQSDWITVTYVTYGAQLNGAETKMVVRKSALTGVAIAVAVLVESCAPTTPRMSDTELREQLLDLYPRMGLCLAAAQQQFEISAQFQRSLSALRDQQDTLESQPADSADIAASRMVFSSNINSLGRNLSESLEPAKQSILTNCSLSTGRIETILQKDPFNTEAVGMLKGCLAAIPGLIEVNSSNLDRPSALTFEDIKPPINECVIKYLAVQKTMNLHPEPSQTTTSTGSQASDKAIPQGKWLTNAPDPGSDEPIKLIFVYEPDEFSLYFHCGENETITASVMDTVYHQTIQNSTSGRIQESVSSVYTAEGMEETKFIFPNKSGVIKNFVDNHIPISFLGYKIPFTPALGQLQQACAGSDQIVNAR